MSGYWGIRTSKEKHDLIGEHLRANQLRQGWGYRDLRLIGEEAARGELDAEGRSVWKYTQRMLDISPGDIVITPHQPSWNRNGAWRVLTEYEFDPLPDVWGLGEVDFGHVIGVEPVGGFDHRSASVSADLRRALTSGFRTRMRQLHDFGPEIEALLESPHAARPADAVAHFEVVRAKAREALDEALESQYSNADFEKPIGALLETLYPNAVKHTAGPAEHGRDFVIDDVDTLGLSRCIIVQVKAWRGSVNDEGLRHGLEQLARGIRAQAGAVDLAVLLTLADELPPDADKTIAIAEEQTSAPTRVLLKDETLDLMLNQIAHIRL